MAASRSTSSSSDAASSSSAALLGSFSFYDVFVVVFKKVLLFAAPTLAERACFFFDVPTASMEARIAEAKLPIRLPRLVHLVDHILSKQKPEEKTHDALVMARFLKGCRGGSFWSKTELMDVIFSEFHSDVLSYWGPWCIEHKLLEAKDIDTMKMRYVEYEYKRHEKEAETPKIFGGDRKLAEMKAALDRLEMMKSYIEERHGFVAADTFFLKQLAAMQLAAM
jgi:hypothetical protein